MHSTTVKTYQQRLIITFLSNWTSLQLGQDSQHLTNDL